MCPPPSIVIDPSLAGPSAEASEVRDPPPFDKCAEEVTEEGAEEFTEEVAEEFTEEPVEENDARDPSFQETAGEFEKARD